MERRKHILQNDSGLICHTSEGVLRDWVSGRRNNGPILVMGLFSNNNLLKTLPFFLQTVLHGIDVL